ncbi:uncharacterized protein BO66DRAFT_389834 [Aspergillus aculeatinus CBS 121060]|uniref:Uncharacterized protein n=1 Tax=Aspergillus aculeatinus CBS 121060 TaxID=1448322 RepID=A0ACD1HGM4_9EURO|nr:hypothetical protein BO66DRAFT_389834 [Aspergillus aculeatinus CBS 121060]RAH72522.1 hypothetical protein BO66DRAFT_389834 [Aspergillus aculeatinus CBS 121060]
MSLWRLLLASHSIQLFQLPAYGGLLARTLGLGVLSRIRREIYHFSGLHLSVSCIRVVNSDGAPAKKQNSSLKRPEGLFTGLARATYAVPKPRHKLHFGMKSDDEARRIHRQATRPIYPMVLAIVAKIIARDAGGETDQS